MLEPLIDGNESRLWWRIWRYCVTRLGSAFGWPSVVSSTNGGSDTAPCTLPLEISDDEKIVRAIKCPSHIRPGKTTLKPAAFRSKPGFDEVSVIRHTHVGSNFCKKKAKETIDSTNSYNGLAVIMAREIRATTSTVHDSRDEFCGHAHISHGIILPRDEPPESALNHMLTERCRALCKAAAYYPDPRPDAEKWTGCVL
jgi:hypothetical protein